MGSEMCIRDRFGVVLIDDFGDGRVEISASIADEAHLGSQHVIPIGTRTVSFVHHYDDLTEIYISNRQLGDSIADCRDVWNIAIEVSEKDWFTSLLINNKQHVCLRSVD